jgi:hypothetical protein
MHPSNGVVTRDRKPSFRKWKEPSLAFSWRVTVKIDAPKAVKKPVAPDPYGPSKAAMTRKLTDPQSAQWGNFWNATQADGGPLVCGAVNAKNTMGGYIGMTGFTYEPKVDRAIMLFSGRTDGDAGIAIRLYRAYCLTDPKADQRANSNSGYIP